MILRSCLDLFSKQVVVSRSLLAIGSQTISRYSKSALYPPPPKRNRSAWIFFFSENFKQIHNANPDLSRAEIFVQMAQKWQNIDKVKLEKYKALAAADKLKYLREIEEYRANLSDEHKLAIAQNKANKMADHRKQLKLLGMPKKPANAYILFSLDFAKKHFESPQDVFKQAAKVASAWADLSASEKSKYVDLAAVKEKEYRKKLEQWESEMTAKGHIEVIETKPKVK